MEDGSHEELLDLERRLDVHGESGNEFQQLGVIVVASLPPADQMQVQFLLKLFRHH